LTIFVVISLIMLHLEGRHEGINNGVLPRGMKSYLVQFSRLPYYEHLEIVHLFDTMHIGKNVTKHYGES
jgi:hypothetical protein